MFARGLTRLRPVAPIVAVLVFSAVYSMTLFVLFGALGFAIPDPTPVATIAPSTIYDTALAAVLGPLAVAVRDRHAEVERADW